MLKTCMMSILAYRNRKAAPHLGASTASGTGTAQRLYKHVRLGKVSAATGAISKDNYFYYIRSPISRHRGTAMQSSAQAPFGRPSTCTLRPRRGSVRVNAIAEVLKEGSHAANPEVPPGLNKFSARITQPKSQGASQAMLYGTGLTEEDMSKPQVMNLCWVVSDRSRSCAVGRNAPADIWAHAAACTPLARTPVRVA